MKLSEAERRLREAVKTIMEHADVDHLEEGERIRDAVEDIAHVADTLQRFRERVGREL